MNFGFRRTLPHILGITFGFVVLLVGCAAGLGAIFTAYPPLQIVLKAAGAIYLLWLAWKIATAKPAADDDERVGRPITFLQAALFQWVNPKAVVIALSAITIYVRPAHWVSDFGLLLAVFAIATILAGRGLDRLRGGLAPSADRSEARPHLQYRDGAAAGGEHRADGDLNRLAGARERRKSRQPCFPAAPNTLFGR